LSDIWIISEAFKSCDQGTFFFSENGIDEKLLMCRARAKMPSETKKYGWVSKKAAASISVVVYLDMSRAGRWR
jgi:hypothetical protein